jgi:hypothetical protein
MVASRNSKIGRNWRNSKVTEVKSSLVWWVVPNLGQWLMTDQ